MNGVYEVERGATLSTWSLPLMSLALVATLLMAVGFGTWLFARWVGRNTALKEDEKVKRWELFLTGTGSLVVVVAGLMGFLRYIDQRGQELSQQEVAQAQKTREFNLQIYGRSAGVEQATRVLLNEVTDLAATLATLEHLEGPESKIAQDRFEKLYHGQLILYEDTDVSNAMVNFRDAMRKWGRSGQKPTELLPEDRTEPSLGHLRVVKRNSDFMRRLALRLSYACRDALDGLKGAQKEAPLFGSPGLPE